MESTPQFGVHELENRPAGQFFNRVTKHSRHVRIDEGGPVAGVDGPNAFSGGLDDTPVPFLAVA
jgi:hypothetical protein